jgi:hypothetical protein
MVLHRMFRAIRGRARFLSCVLLALPTMCIAAAGQELAFENEFVRLALTANGSTQSLLEKSDAHEWHATEPRAFASVKKAGKYHPASGLTRDGELWRVDFRPAQVQVDFRVTAAARYVVFELVRVQGESVEEVRFGEMQVTCRENAGWWLGAYWNERFAVALVGLSDRVNVQLLGNGVLAASVYPEFGMEGQRTVLVAAPKSQFLSVVQEVERDFGLPSPRLGGQWAKTSRAVHTGYLFTDLTESNADETIRFTRLGGFEYIMTYSGTWSSSLGSYPINTSNFPQGEASLKATVDKCHAAGLKAGLHFLTSFVDKSDPLVRPRPDPRLLKDDQATLAADVDEKTVEITATGPLTSFPTEGAFYGDTKAGFDIQIDDELIQYRAIGGQDSHTFLRCTRGFAGTRAAPHKAGAKIHHLVERYGCYLADLRTTLKGEISDRVAGVINRCGFDMVYFDGGECNMANGPFWYWVSQQQDDICRRVTRELLVQGSGGTAWTWHWFARGCCDDFAAIAPKQYLDHHKIADSWTYYAQSFMPADLGWWGFLADEPDHPATMPDEVEYYAARMLAMDTPVSLETNLAALKRNGRTEEMLTRLGEHERLRLSGAVPKAVKDKLRTGEWRLTQDNSKPAFSPIRYDVQRVAVPGELTVTNLFGAQPMKFRLQAVPALAPMGDKANLTLLRNEPATEIGPPAANAPMPGAMANQTNFASPMDLAASSRAGRSSACGRPGYSRERTMRGVERAVGGRRQDLPRPLHRPQLHGREDDGSSRADHRAHAAGVPPRPRQLRLQGRHVRLRLPSHHRVEPPLDAGPERPADEVQHRIRRGTGRVGGPVAASRADRRRNDAGDPRGPEDRRLRRVLGRRQAEAIRPQRYVALLHRLPSRPANPPPRRKPHHSPRPRPLPRQIHLHHHRPPSVMVTRTPARKAFGRIANSE